MDQHLSTRHVKFCMKDYECSSCNWLREAEIDKGLLTFQERRHIIQAKWDGWKILKGQPCIKMAYIFEGEFYEDRFRPEIHAICKKYELYPDD